MSDYQKLNIRQIREELFKMTQKPFAEGLNIKYRTYQGYESQGVPPSKLRKLKDKLVEYAKEKGIEYVLVEENSNEKKSLSDYSYLEIVEYISDNIDNFKSLSTFNRVVGLTAYSEKINELQSDIDELRSLMDKLKNNT